MLNTKLLRDEAAHLETLGTAHGAQALLKAAAGEIESLADTNAATEAIKFALSTDEGMAFLKAWAHGEFEAIRREWPECPAAVFVGAEPEATFASQGKSGFGVT